MSIRAVWVVSMTGPANLRILFSRTFPTVEKRCGQLEGAEYVPLPTYQTFTEGLLQATRHTALQQTGQGEPACSQPDQKPVFEVKTQWGALWPLVIVEQHGYLFCGLPLVEQASHTKPALVQIPGVSAVFSLLLGMAEFTGPLPKGLSETSPKMADLYLYLDQAAPFGEPLDVSSTTVKLGIKSRNIAGNYTQKQPAWKPVQFKGKPQITVIIKEQVRSLQYDKAEGETCDSLELYGSVICRADLEGVVPDISLTLTQADESLATPLDHVIYHPFVQSVETQGNFLQGSSSSGGGCCRIRLTPPLETFPLCHYTCSSIKKPPLLGCYQMKGEKVVEILCQLKLGSNVRNNFEHCEVQMPFFHRGAILNHECSLNHGSLAVSACKTKLVWDIGPKFPSKTLECLMKATVHFGKYMPSKGKSTEENFCVGHNAFAQIVFKLSDYTHSQLMLDPKSLQVSPAAKFKLTTVREFVSNEYRIWNSHGDSPGGFDPPDTLVEDIQTSHFKQTEDSQTS